MSIFMSKFAWDDYSAMQWPCPSGFHIPTNTEWSSIKTIWTSLWWWSSDWSGFSVSTKMPLAWYRSNQSWVSAQGSDGMYSSSIRNWASYIYAARITSTVLNLPQSQYPCYWLSIRPFKDISVVPTSSWTKLYWTSIESWGIFWSSTDWLISLSSDWQTWITIADKNLWATTVWNNWDTLSQANCWNYYQWGNNYSFPRTWSVTTSTTQVNASTYWPWNYYSSSTFITRSSSPYDWSSVQNDNLWGWKTWVVQSTWEPKKIYIRVEAQPITTAWIYHNSDLWLISLSSDGSNWITIADKNLWATTVYNSWDTLSEANCGKYYQWGNNYWFARTWSVTTATSRVDVSNYWPNNYYNSSTFIKISSYEYGWWTTDNYNLRWWQTWTNAAMRWPCDEWYHIPSWSELQNIVTIWTSLGGSSTDGTNFWKALKLPFAWRRERSSSNVYNQGTQWYYWAATHTTSNAYYWDWLSITSSSLSGASYDNVANWHSIRPFANTPTQPDDSRTKLY